MQKTRRGCGERGHRSPSRIARVFLSLGSFYSRNVPSVLRAWHRQRHFLLGRSCVKQTLIFKTTTENSTLQLLCVFIPKVGYVILFLWTLLVLSLSNCILFTCIYTLNLRKGKGAIALSTSYLLIYIEKTNTFKLETSFILGTENTVSWLQL